MSAGGAKPKRQRGRRLKLTAKVQDKIVTVIKAGNYCCVAAAYAGVAASTFWSWMQKGEEQPKSVYGKFRAAVLEAESFAEVRANTIIQKAMEDNWVAAMTFLERKFPDRWGRRQRVEMTGANGGPIQTEAAPAIDLDKLSTDELMVLEKLSKEHGGAAIPRGLGSDKSA